MTVRVLQVSDVHLTTSPLPDGADDPGERLDLVLAAAVERLGRPDLVVASGDLTDDGSRDACARLGERLRALGCGYRAEYLAMTARAVADGFPLGFGKQSGGVVKNHYPKGLRNLK